MYGTYTLASGKKIYVYLWDDTLKGYNYRKSTSGYYKNLDWSNGKEFNINILKGENNRLYFEIDGEKKYFNDYEYKKIDELLNDFAFNREKLTNADFIATFMKDTENVGFLTNLSKNDYIVPDTAISISTDYENEYNKILCVLTTKDYDKSFWSYKVTLEAENSELNKIYASEIVHLTDLVWAIKRGVIELVNKNEYKKLEEKGISKTLK